MQKIITLVGGTGAMGSLFSRYWQQQNHVVRTLDKNDWDNAQELLHNCDLVVICVPINLTAEIIQKTANFLAPTTILADFTSVKTKVMALMQQVHPGPTLGLHPMFGPSITIPHNQVIIHCGGTQPEKSQWVIDSFKTMGFNIVDVPANTHDEMMGFIQGIEHFSTFALGTFLQQYNLHPQTLFNVASPIYQAKLALMGRIFDQDPSLYADIIMADEARIELIAKYVDYMQDLVQQLQRQNKAGFIQTFTNASKWMGNFTHDSQIASDKFLTTIPESYKP